MAYKRFGLVLTAAVALSAVPPANAQTKVSVDTGNGLIESCKSEDKVPLYACYGYVTGVDDLHTYEQIRNNRMYYCKPKGATIPQLAAIAVRYLEQHPDERHLPSSMILISAFAESFPCGTTGSE